MRPQLSEQWTNPILQARRAKLQKGGGERGNERTNKRSLALGGVEGDKLRVRKRVARLLMAVAVARARAVHKSDYLQLQCQDCLPVTTICACIGACTQLPLRRTPTGCVCTTDFTYLLGIFICLANKQGLAIFHMLHQRATRLTPVKFRSYGAKADR